MVRRTKKDEYLKMYNFLTNKKLIKAGKASKPERQVLEECTSYLKSLQGYGVEYRRNNVGMFYTQYGSRVQCGKKGDGDLMVLINGKHYEVECKGKGGKLSTEQSDRKLALGDRYIVVYDVEELKTALEPLLPDIFLGM